MNINYLTKYDNIKDSLSNYRIANPEGKTMQEIVELETLFNQGNPFPKAFREYLFIGGKFNALGFEDAIDGNFKGMMKYYDHHFQGRGMQLDRPYMVYHDFEGKACSFIYLDEGDDPQPWNASVNKAYDTDEGERIWKVPHPSFSDLVNTLVERALKGVQPW